METQLLLEVVDRLNGVIDKMISLDARLGRVITALERRSDALQRAETEQEQRDDSRWLRDEKG